ncbi:MAG: DUF4345 family protein [Chloroflexota bacterium]
MDIALIPTLKNLTALASVIFGIVALFQPQATASAASLKADTAKGIAEIRASWGGLFIGLGLAVIIIGTPEAFQVFAAAYAMTAIVRLITWVLDTSIISRTGIIILTFEVVSAIIFALPEGAF